MKDTNLFEQQSLQRFCDDSIASYMGKYDNVPGVNHPYDSGTTSIPFSILDSGANSAFVNDRQLLTNTSSPSSPLVQVSDGTLHPIVAPGTLLIYLNIKADFVVCPFLQILLKYLLLLIRVQWL